MTFKKNKQTFVLCALILAILLPFALSACNSASDNENVTSSESEDVTPKLPVPVSLDGYTVIRAEKASDEIRESATGLFGKLKALASDVKIADDWLKPGDAPPLEAKEILIGATSRDESAEVLNGLPLNDYVIRYFEESGRIVICGGCDSSTVDAVDYFIKNYLKSSIMSDLYYKHADSYDVVSCTLNGHAIEDYTIVIPKKANNDEEYAATLIRDAIADKTGIITKISKDSDIESTEAPLIIIGSTSITPDKFSLSDNSYILGNDGNNIIISGDNGMVVYSAKRFTEKLFASDSDSVSVSLDGVKKFEKKTVSLPVLNDFGKYPIALADQKNACIAVYDLSPVKNGGNAELKWTFKPTSAKGFSADSTYGNRIDEARLRYSEKLSSYVVAFTSSSGYVGLASYPEGKCIWEAKPKLSPHTIEYLPNGYVAIACSGGSDTSKGIVRVYDPESSAYDEVKLVSAHGLLWDDTREILWALGGSEIVAYEVGTDKKAPILKKIESYGTNSVRGGHDMSVIYGDENNIWISGKEVWQFNRATGALVSNYEGKDIISSSSVKCICSFPDGAVARTMATGVYADHNTDTLSLYFFVDGQAQKDIVFDGRAFYKARIFLPDYS